MSDDRFPDRLDDALSRMKPGELYIPTGVSKEQAMTLRDEMIRAIEDSIEEAGEMIPAGIDAGVVNAIDLIIRRLRSPKAVQAAYDEGVLFPDGLIRYERAICMAFVAATKEQ
jgi:hypothetical protein